MIALFVALVFGTAEAADLVVYGDGDAAAAVAQVARHARVAPSELRGVRLSELIGNRPPTLLGSGRVFPCTGRRTTLGEVTAAAERAKGSVAFMDYAQALVDADAALGALSCLTESADGAMGSRILFLRGVALYYAGNVDEARAAFRQAHLFQPGLGWDPDFPTEPQRVFDEALSELANAQTARITVVPGPAAVPVVVDGRRITRAVSVSAGDHLVQVGGPRVASVRVNLVAGGDSTLLVTDAVDDTAVRWASEDERRGELSLVLAAVVGDGFVVYVVHGERSYRLTTGETAWERLDAPEPTATATTTPTTNPTTTPTTNPTTTVATTPPTTTTRPPVGSTPLVETGTPFVEGPTDPAPRAKKMLWWLLPPGVGALGFGAGYGTHSYLKAKDALEAANDAETVTEYDQHAADYTAWGKKLTTAEIVGGIGAAITVLGLAIRVEDTTVVPVISGGGAGVQLRWTR